MGPVACDFVGSRAEAAGQTPLAVAALCRQTAERWTMGQLRVQYDGNPGTIVAVDSGP
jgi:hypothetical protein